MNTGGVSWSPDGSKIIYTTVELILTTINPDGSNPTSLGVSGNSAAWAPDGSKIAYFTTTGNIFTVNPDGTGAANLTNLSHPVYAFSPNWSPDSTKIAYTRSDFGAGTQQTYTINRDGSGNTNLSNDTQRPNRPVWSPDGTKIAFNQPDGLYTMNADGTAKTRFHEITTGQLLVTDWAPQAKPAPSITGLNPTTGPKAGGTAVTITGTRFTGATAVTFGTTPATAFTVNSDTSITATAPASATVGPVDVTVTTPTGTSPISPAGRYTNTYSFAGFFPPVDNPPALNKVNAGSTVPVKFSLGGDQGLAILASGSPSSQQYDCATGTPVGVAQPTSGALDYDAGSDRYQYNWVTDKAWEGTCRTLTVTLTDTTTRTANFQLH